jgi:Uma2 family endonuclease
MAALTQPLADSGVPLPRKRFTREEVNRLLEEGFFDGQRFELIDGDLIDKMGQNPPHASAIRRLMVLLATTFGIERLMVQAPIEAGPRDRKWSQPEPDLAVLAAASDHSARHPDGHELSLAVEVADSSVRHDANRKRDMYAAAGVPEYWVLDLDSRRLLVFRNLQGTAYSESLVLTETEQIPHIEKPVSELL